MNQCDTAACKRSVLVTFPFALQQVPVHRRVHGGHRRPQPCSELWDRGGLRQQRFSGVRVLLAPPQREPSHPAGHQTDEGPRPQARGQEDQTR